MMSTVEKVKKKKKNITHIRLFYVTHSCIIIDVIDEDEYKK